MPLRLRAETPTHVLGDELIRLTKLLAVVRSQSLRPHPDVDPMAYALLFRLVDGGVRVSELADQLHSDVSTVSRQVTHLTRYGFIAKGRDPDDGRAQLLELTESGVEMLAALRQARDAWLGEVVQDWTTDDLTLLSTGLARLADDVEAHLRADTDTAAADTDSDEGTS